MPYIGRSNDKISNIEVLDNITFDGSSSYSITKGSVAFTPNSAQSLLISIDGVVQATNFTVNSSTIDFGVAIPSTSVCNFFLHYGTGVMTVPSDGSVTTAKIGSNAVSSAKMFSGFANGITMADQWRLTANLNTTSDPISSNLERIDTTSQGTLGTGMTESSGIFSFPSTGIYLVRFNFTGESSSDSFAGYIYATNDNSTYYELNEVFVRNNNGFNENASMETLIDVTNTSNVKVKFVAGGMAGTNNTIMYGSTSKNATYFTFIRLGDT